MAWREALSVKDGVLSTIKGQQGVSVIEVKVRHGYQTTRSKDGVQSGCQEGRFWPQKCLQRRNHGGLAHAPRDHVTTVEPVVTAGLVNDCKSRKTVLECEAVTKES